MSWLVDVFDLLVPTISPAAGLHAQESAFGTVEGRALRDGMVIGERAPIHAAHARLLGDRVHDLQSWSVLSLARAANDASELDRSWKTYRAHLHAILDVHDRWFIVAGSDCDQHPIEARSMSAEALLDLVDMRRSRVEAPLALLVEGRWPARAAKATWARGRAE